jgi:hypothetical protein
MRSQRLQRLSALLFTFLGTTSVLGAQVQKSGLVLPPGTDKLRQDVVDVFTETYSAYTYVSKSDPARHVLSSVGSMPGDTIT